MIVDVDMGADGGASVLWMWMWELMAVRRGAVRCGVARCGRA